MKAYPHEYIVKAKGKNIDNLALSSQSGSFDVSPPSQFGGTDDVTSPEELFAASIASCFILTLRALSRHKKMDWLDVTVDAKCILDRGSDGASFTECELDVKLSIHKEKNIEDYIKLLENSEKSCLISNSIKAKISLKPRIKVVL